MEVPTISKQEQLCLHGSEDPGPSEAGHGRGVPPGHEHGVQEVTLIQLVNIVLRHWRMVVLVPVLFAFAMGVFSLLQQRTYTAAASFTPQGFNAPASGIADLASQFGLSIGGLQGNAPQFYADLLISREILQKASETRYTFPSDTGTVNGTLVELFDFEGPRRERLRRTLVELERRLSISTAMATGVVEVAAVAGSPALAEQIVGRLIELVNDFNLEWRQSQATEERRFIEGRLQAVQSELEDAETDLKRFLEQNRRFENSPELVFEHDRLQRQVTMRQAIVTALATAHEEARIAEVRNTPLISLIERPEGSGRPNPRRTVLKVLLGLILGTMLGALIAFTREFLDRTAARQTEDIQEFVALRRGVLRELQRAGRIFRKVAAG